MTIDVYNHQLCRCDEDGRPIESISDEVSVVKKIKDLSSNSTTVQLEVWAGGEAETYELARKEIFDRSFIGFLLDKDVSIINDLDAFVEVSDYVIGSDVDAPVEYRHKSLGFMKINDCPVFLAYHPIGIADPLKKLSTYHIPEMVKPRGTLDSWKNFLSEEVLGDPKLELALALGATGPVTYLLRLNRKISLNPLIGIIGLTSTGKTSTLALMASIFGSPSETDGLLRDLYATENGFSAMLAESNGLTALIDEGTLQADWDFTRILYGMAKGIDKRRCNQDGTTKEQKRFWSSVIISSERSLFCQSKDMPGLRSRLIEFSQVWTASGEHADRILEGSANNYGTAVVPLIDWLLDNQQRIADIYFEEIKIFNQMREGTTNGVEKRILKTYALIITSAHALNESLGLYLNLDEMRKHLLSFADDQMPSISAAEKVYEEIQAGVIANASMFLPVKDAITSRWGEFSVYKENSCIWITQNGIEKILGKKNPLDRTMLKELHGKSLIHYFGDRYLKKRFFGKIAANCYCFPTKQNVDLSKKEKFSTKKSARSRLACGKSLLDDDNIVKTTADTVTVKDFSAKVSQQWACLISDDDELLTEED